MEQKVTTSQYRKIAMDIARNIAEGKYKEGQKLFGRSVLASHYKVSPETVRKAVHILKDMGIVETEKGSGVEVVSAEKAKEFIKSCGEVESLGTIKREIEDWVKSQAAQTTNMLDKIRFLMQETERVAAVSPLNPYQIRITADCTAIGKTAHELQFWHKTGGTIVAIRRGERLILSPGPYASFLQDDFFFIVGDEESYSASLNLLFN